MSVRITRSASRAAALAALGTAPSATPVASESSDDEIVELSAAAPSPAVAAERPEASGNEIVELIHDPTAFAGPGSA